MPAFPCCGGDIALRLRCVHINLRLNGAGEGNRTLIVCLGSTSSTIELHPLCPVRISAVLSQENNVTPIGDSAQTYLAIGYHVEVCTLSRRGNLFILYPHHYSTAFAFSTILYPLWFQITLRFSLSTVLARHHIGLTTFRINNKSWEGSAFSPETLCQRTRTKQASNRSRAILAGARYSKSSLARSSLTTFNSSSLMLTLQPSLAPHPDTTSEITPCPSREMTRPRGRLHCQNA